jgi:hypothetical protein
MVVKAFGQLEQFLSPVMDRLTPETARALVDFRFDAQTQARVAELAEKANEGLLTDDERQEYAEFVELGDLVGILQARARKVLRRQDP